MPSKVAALFISLMLAVGLAGCGSSQGGEEPASRDEGGATAEAEAEAPPLDVTIDEPAPGTEVTSARVRVAGTVSPPDASVEVNGQSMDVSGGSWSGRVELDLGENPLNAVATVEGTTDQASDSVDVRRKRTAAQRAAFREAQRRKRERRIAELKATAKPIDPEILQKNPDRHTGEKVVISGEVFQIQENSAEGSFMMLNTGCETEYEVRICDGPTVHVTYSGSNDKTEDDFVTVYGTVTGGLEYETQIGGSNFVASIEAEVVE